MKNIGSSLTLAMALTASPGSSSEAPKGLPVVSQTQMNVEASIRPQSTGISLEGSGALILLGSFLLLASRAEYSTSAVGKMSSAREDNQS